MAPVEPVEPVTPVTPVAPVDPPKYDKVVCVCEYAPCRKKKFAFVDPVGVPVVCTTCNLITNCSSNEANSLNGIKKELEYNFFANESIGVKSVDPSTKRTS